MNSLLLALNQESFGTQHSEQEQIEFLRNNVLTICNETLASLNTYLDLIQMKRKLDEFRWCMTWNGSDLGITVHKTSSIAMVLSS